MVMRLPSRSRCTSLPSLTARRPNVDSAISAWRQNSEIRLRIWSFFIAEGTGARFGSFGTDGWAAADSVDVLPPSAHYWNAGIGPGGLSGSQTSFPRLQSSTARSALIDRLVREADR